MKKKTRIGDLLLYLLITNTNYTINTYKYTNVDHIGTLAPQLLRPDSMGVAAATLDESTFACISPGKMS